MLDALHAGALALDISRFHRGGALSPDEWEEQWFRIICEPHFSYVLCALSSSDDVAYKRLVWIQDDALTPSVLLFLLLDHQRNNLPINSISKRLCANLPSQFPVTPPFVTFNGFVDTEKFPLADNPGISLHETTRNSSAIFKVWSRFAVTGAAATPKTGWYANNMYAMLPNCKPHMKQKCSDYRAETTPFRQNGKKAYVTGYLWGFCHKDRMFSADCPYIPLDFVPLVEISKIDWAVGEPKQHTVSRDPFATPSPRDGPGGRKGKFLFDPFAQITIDAKDPASPSRPARTSSLDQTSKLSTPETEAEDSVDVFSQGKKREADNESVAEGSDGPTPVKRSKQGSLRGRKRFS